MTNENETPEPLSSHSYRGETDPVTLLDWVAEGRTVEFVIHQKMVGMLIAEFALAEMILAEVVRSLSGIDVETAKLLTEPMSGSQLREVAKELLKAGRIVDPLNEFRMKEAVDQLAAIARFRNMLTHGYALDSPSGIRVHSGKSFRFDF